VQQQRGVGREIVEQRGRFFKEQRQVILDAGGHDAVGDILVERDARGVALKHFPKALAEHRAARFAGRHFARRQQANFRHRIERALAVDIEAAQGLDLVVEQLDAIGQGGAHREQIDQPAAHAVFAGRDHLGHMLIAGQCHLCTQLVEIQLVALFHEEGVGGKERGRGKAGGGRWGRDDQDIALPLCDGKQRGEAFRDQILMRREVVVGQCFPVGQQVHAQGRGEPVDFLGKALCFKRRCRDRCQQAAGRRQLRNGEGIGGAGKRGK